MNKKKPKASHQLMTALEAYEASKKTELVAVKGLIYSATCFCETEMDYHRWMFGENKAILRELGYEVKEVFDFWGNFKKTKISW